MWFRVSCRHGEARVALVPDAVARLVGDGFAVAIERGAGTRSFAPDDAYRSSGAAVIDDRAELLREADVVLTVRGLGGTEDESFARDLASVARGAAVIGLLDPYDLQDRIQSMADHGVLAFALERMPRITRAQSMGRAELNVDHNRLPGGAAGRAGPRPACFPC